MRKKRVLKWISVFFIIFFVLLLLLLIGTMLFDGQIKNYVLKRLNQQVDDYRVEVKEFDLNPFLPGFRIHGLLLRQVKYPDPPILQLDTAYFNLHWHELFSGKIAGFGELIEPDLYVNLPNLKEIPKRPSARKWQTVLKEFYPLEITRFEIEKGEATYITSESAKPLRIPRFQITTKNISNLNYPDQSYPASYKIEAVIFESGRFEADGNVSFLRLPYPGVKGNYQFTDISLGNLKSLLDQHGIILTSGTFNSRGNIEFSPEIQRFQIRNVNISDLKVDYIQRKKTAPKDEPSTRKIPFQYSIDEMRIRGETGYVNKTADPEYRLYFSQTDLNIKGLSDHFRTGGADVKVTGKFMGSGDTLINGTFDMSSLTKPKQPRPDFFIRTRMVGTRLEAMNNLFRAYAGLDVAAGTMTIYSEFDVNNGRVDGFVKPFFANVDIYAEEQEKREDLLQKAYEGFVDIITDFLEDEPRRMATKIDLSGPLANPDAGTLEALFLLIQQAFSQAVLPGFKEGMAINSKKSSPESAENLSKNPSEKLSILTGKIPAKKDELIIPEKE